jgi:hypothetical protein
MGEPPGNGKVGVPMATGGEPGPEVGEPPGGGKEGISILTGNEPGRKAGEPPATRPTPKDMKKRRKKGGGAANSMRPSRNA